MDCGFEAVGVIVAAGPDVQGVKVGDAVAATSYGAFSEFQLYRARAVLPMPTPDAHFLPLLVSGLTASIALEQTGEMKQVGVNGAPRETVLITAAAGATGLFAVQLAKAAGHHVIATCSSDDKVAVLKGLGADRVINYKKENFGEVLRKEYPKGINIVYESVGGEMFNECVKNLAVKGRLIVIGFVSGYADGSAWKGRGASGAVTKSVPPLPAMILGKSASIRGFFLNDFGAEFKRHMQLLTRLMAEGKLQSIVDPTHFQGLEQIPDAIDYMYKGANVGKVVVDLAPELHTNKKTTRHQSKL
jgi:NADPH-dependent curcumin reductase CurA